MNLRFLGDAMDHWKGSIIGRLSKMNMLDSLRADQIASDFSQWGEVDHALYANLLGISKSMLIQHEQPLWENRRKYLEEILTIDGDLFLDPDIGISTNSQTGAKHLKASEVHAILDESPTRIVMVYQHIRAQNTRERVIEVLDWVQEKGPDFSCYSYESGTVAMLFFSRRTDRLGKIGKYFKDLLDWHAKERVYYWHRQRPNLTLLKGR